MVVDCFYYYCKGPLTLFLRASVFKVLDSLCKIYQLLCNFTYASQQLLINFFCCELFPAFCFNF